MKCFIFLVKLIVEEFLRQRKENDWEIIPSDQAVRRRNINEKTSREIKSYLNSDTRKSDSI